AENYDPAGAEPCRPGYVWREARPSDHVCVPVARRTAVARENRIESQSGGGVPPPAPPPAPPAQATAACVQVTVWRAASRGDFVCVPPASRSLAARENADPAAADPCR